MTGVPTCTLHSRTTPQTWWGGGTVQPDVAWQRISTCQHSHSSALHPPPPYEPQTEVWITS